MLVLAYASAWRFFEVTGSTDWAVVFREVGVGLGVLLAGIGFLYASLQLGVLLRRVGSTLDQVDRQIGSLSVPVEKTLDHISGIANTADETLARAGAAVGGLERVASALSRGVALVGSALSPAVINLGATVAGITTGLRRLVRGEPGR